MGALTSNRKRGDECLSLNAASQISPNFQNSKRPRVSYMKQIPQRSSISRFSRYPVAKPPLPRVHAPCRPNKFGSLSPIGALSCSKTKRVFEDEELEDRMGNVLAYHAEKAKTAALGSCKYLNKGKEVIELDKDVGNGPVSDDSSIEEVVVVDDEDNNGHEMDTEMVDCGAQGTQPSTSSVVSELTMAAKNTPSKSDSDGKMLYSLALSRGEDMSSKQVYKKLLEEAEKRSPKLQYLDFQIELNVNRLSLYESLRPQKKPAVAVEPFLPLTEEEEAEVDEAFSYSNRRRVLVTHENSNIQITGEMLKCLGPGAWLNDEVINVYLELLKEREKREPDKFLKCHFFNTFFYKKLKSGKGGYDYKSVRRWTTQKKLGYSLVECDKIFVPIHKEVHWCLAVINNVDKKFQYLDSLRGKDADVMKILPKYYVDEVKDKSGKDIDLSSWTLEYVKELPEQENGFDCGVFMVKYADFYSRGLDLCFEQEHMPYFRLRTAKEILKLRAD